MRGDQDVGELLEDVIDLITILVPRHLFQRLVVSRHCAHIAVVGEVHPFWIDSDAVRDQSVGARHVEFCAPVGLRYLIEDKVPIGLPVKVGQQHERRVGDEQDFAIHRRVLSVVYDIGDHSIAGLAVDRTEPDFWCQTGEAVHGLVDEKDARLNEENFLAKPRESMGMSDGFIRLRRAT